MATDDEKTVGMSGLFDHLRKDKMLKVEHLLKKGDYVEGADLAAALREQPDAPVPPHVLDYLCRYLDGDVAKPKGRKAIPRPAQRHVRMIMRYHYQRTLAWLKRRRKRYGHLHGWSALRGKTWWQGPPNERAARIVAEKFYYGAESWRTVHNIVSSRD